MKLITDLTNDEEFLGALYACAEIVDECLTKTHVMNFRKRMPENVPKISKNDSKSVIEKKTEVRNQLFRDQAMKNLMDMAKVLMKEQPEHAIKLMRSLIVLDEGEEFPTGMKLFSVGIKAFSNTDVLDFFSTLMQLDRALSGASFQE